jgi:signal transduction histidine kinase
MKPVSLMLQIDKKLNILWAGPELKDLFPKLESFKDKEIAIFDLFNSSDKQFKPFYRWISSTESAEVKFNLILNNEDKEAVNVGAWKSGDLNYLKINPVVEKTAKLDFENSFWSYFSKSFPGGFVFLNNANDIFEISQALINNLRLSDPNGIQYSKKALLGKNFFDLLSLKSKKVADLFLDNLNNTKSMGEIHEVSDPVLLENKHFKIFISKVTEEGVKMGACLYLIDVSKEFLQRRELEAQRQQLFNSSKLASLGEMAGGIAHEINNPLAIISTSTILLKKVIKVKGFEDLKLESLVNNIEKTTERISKIILGLRSITGNEELSELNVIPLSTIIENSLSVCQEKFKADGIIIEKVTSGCSFDDTIYCNDVQISQVLLNLVTNSSHALELLDEKWIRLEISQEEDKFKFSVTDSGTGINTDISDEIFNPFFSSKEVGKGTGLGLSISKQIAEKHGGELYLDRNSKNTKFTLELPAVKL